MQKAAVSTVQYPYGGISIKVLQQVYNIDTQTISLDMKLTKQDIAEMVGTTVETSIRVMSRFTKAGLIKNTGGRIIIRNRKGLLAAVNPS